MKTIAAAALIFALGGFFLSAALSFQSVGLAQGLTIGDTQLEEYRAQQGIRFSGQGYETYDRVASEYRMLALLFFIVAGLCLVQLIFGERLGMLIPVSCLLFSAMIVINLQAQIRDKSLIEEWVLDAPRNGFFKMTMTYDWVLVVLVAGIVATSIALIVRIVRDQSYVTG